jgi:hypothetical protein
MSSTVADTHTLPNSFPIEDEVRWRKKSGGSDAEVVGSSASFLSCECRGDRDGKARTNELGYFAKLKR